MQIDAVSERNATMLKADQQRFQAEKLILSQRPAQE